MSKYVSGGSFGIILRSEDGESPAAVASKITVPFYSISYRPLKFVLSFIINLMAAKS
jgi:hypothetical protein